LPHESDCRLGPRAPVTLVTAAALPYASPQQVVRVMALEQLLDRSFARWSRQHDGVL
jgi:hypothetical protein